MVPVGRVRTRGTTVLHGVEYELLGGAVTTAIAAATQTALVSDFWHCVHGITLWITTRRLATKTRQIT